MDLAEILDKATEDMTPEEIAFLPDYHKAVRGLIYDPSIYDANWFQHQDWQHPWIERLMGWWVGQYGRPASSLDLGAGDGHYSQVLGEMGADPAVAVEVSPDAMPVMEDKVQGIVHDLRRPLDLGRGFELVLCLEVAEHLPLSAADTLCDTISLHCQRYLLFTAAGPGQGGHGHCNLQPYRFWQDRLAARGLMFLPRETVHIKVSWERILGKELPWLPRNIGFFQRH